MDLRRCGRSALAGTLVGTGLLFSAAYAPATCSAAQDGQEWIAFDTSYGIHLVRPDGSAQKMLVPRRGARNPEWSPDGRWLAYERRANETAVPGAATQIRLIRPDGTGDRLLTRGHTPAWSPDGREVRFQRKNPFGLTQSPGTVLAINVRTGTVRVVSRHGVPRRSADDKLMVFWGAEGVSAEDSDRGFTVVPIDGAPDRPFLGPLRFAWTSFLDWTPQGEFYYSCVEPSQVAWDICLVNATTGKSRRIGIKGRQEQELSYSPDRRRMAIAGRDGLYVRAATGREPPRWLFRNVAPTNSSAPFAPTWQPR